MVSSLVAIARTGLPRPGCPGRASLAVLTGCGSSGTRYQPGARASSPTKDRLVARAQALFLIELTGAYILTSKFCISSSAGRHGRPVGQCSTRGWSQADQNAISLVVSCEGLPK
jgi:hypothetical protein